MTRAAGCRLWDESGREYLDTIMALGAVALGYGHPAVTEAAYRALQDGAVGSLAPVLEEELADRLLSWVPGAEAVRFFKTGAEAVAAAVRIARVETGRERVVTCGYQGWLDWCQDSEGVPEVVRSLRSEIPFNDVSSVKRIDAADGLAAVVIEPVVEEAPRPDWLEALRLAADRTGAILIFDELKTGIRFGPGGAAARYGGQPDLVVLGKALGNGLPIAAVAGPAPLMEAAIRTWISSTLATEFVALAAANAVIETFERTDAHLTITRAGLRFLQELERLAGTYPDVITGVRGIPEFSYLTFRDEAVSAAVASGAASRGLLFKRSAYNFVSAAHDDDTIDEVITRLEATLAEIATAC